MLETAHCYRQRFKVEYGSRRKGQSPAQVADGALPTRTISSTRPPVDHSHRLELVFEPREGLKIAHG